jgi:hypothetical protein
MGSYGSGSRGYSSRDTTSAYRGLDVRRWQRGGLLCPERQFMWQWLRDGHVIASIRVRTELHCVWLSYCHRRSDEPWKDEAYSIHIEWTPCNYGGTRAWFRCPVRGCGRRVAILYENGIFACRTCHQLVYESQRMPAHDRALRKVQAIRVKLGGSGSMADFFPPKPKGMHYRTYERLSMEAETADTRSWPPSLLRLLHR